MPVPGSSEAETIEQPADEIEEVQEQTTEEVRAEDGQQQEQTFTRAEVEAMLSDFEKKMESRIQSQVAKSENRTDQRIQERLKALEENKGVLNLSDQEYSAAQDAIIRDEQTKAYKQPAREAPGNGDPTPDYDMGARYVNDQIEAVFRKVGVNVTPDMPEGKLISEALDNPQGSLAETLIAAHEAATKAKQRLESFKGKAKARVPGGGEGSNTHQIKPKTAEEKISSGLKNTQWSSTTPQK